MDAVGEVDPELKSFNRHDAKIAMFGTSQRPDSVSGRHRLTGALGDSGLTELLLALAPPVAFLRLDSVLGLGWAYWSNPSHPI